MVRTVKAAVAVHTAVHAAAHQALMAVHAAVLLAHTEAALAAVHLVRSVVHAEVLTAAVHVAVQQVAACHAAAEDNYTHTLSFYYIFLNTLILLVL